jgi:hypothetical protein
MLLRSKRRDRACRACHCCCSPFNFNTVAAALAKRLCRCSLQRSKANVEQYESKQQRSAVSLSVCVLLAVMNASKQMQAGSLAHTYSLFTTERRAFRALVCFHWDISIENEPRVKPPHT